MGSDKYFGERLIPFWFLAVAKMLDITSNM